MFEFTKTGEKKERPFLFRFTNEEYVWLQAEAKKNKMNMTNFLRYLIGLGRDAMTQIDREI